MSIPLTSDGLPDFTHIIRSGDLVVCGQACAEPRTLTEALIAQRHRLPPFKLVIGPVFSSTFADAPDLQFLSYGVIGQARQLAKRGQLGVIPSHYSEFSNAFESGRTRADVVLIQLSSLPAPHGLSTGLSNDYVLHAARHARTVLAEINADTPWTFDSPWPADIDIALQITATRKPLELPPHGHDEVSRRIGDHVAALIPDGATLQFGVGKIPDAVLSSLSHLRDLGVHSGIVSDTILDLVECGAITNAKKGVDAGITVTNQLIGTHRLYHFAHMNPSISVRAANYTHAYGVLARLNRLIAINSALEVGLDGSVNAETLDGELIGALGGQVDFVRGALASPGGHSVIALPATAKFDKSRIVPRVETVTTARADADVVVTEWGVAHLRGCSIAERARRMIAIAAPQHREALQRAAFTSRNNA